MTFYDSDAALTDTAGRYLRDATRTGAAAVVIAAGDHRRAFERELPSPALPRGGSAPVWLDARWVLARIVSGERVDRVAFRRVVGTLLRTAAQAGRPVRVYGEMVALLWDAGNVPAALALERLWNELAGEVAFTLLCAYPSAVVTGGGRDEAVLDLCRLHTHVVDPEPSHDSEGIPSVCALLPPTSAAPGAARRLVVDALGRRGCDRTLVYDAQLVVTELATNAVVHGRTPFWVVAHVGEETVRISIQDGSRTRPRMRRSAATATSGRGLQLVDLLAREWDADPARVGKVVRADLDRVRQVRSGR